MSARDAVIPDSPTPLLLRPIAHLAAPIYAAVVDRRNERFDRGEGVRRIDRPVISVGNITVGGTGKTPMVSWIASTLLDAGHRPVIAMRGYGARRGERSDEQLEHERRLPDVPVVAHPDRYESLTSFFRSRPDHDCVILDDGFQHRRLHRDLDLVLIDATRPPFNDRLLPVGWLREPIRNLARADAVIVTRADIRDDEMAGLIWRETVQNHGKPPITSFKSEWSRLRIWSRSAEGERIEPSVWLARRRVVATCGIANPQAFLDMLEMAGATVIDRLILRDHAPYDSAALRRLAGMAQHADAIVTTEKDWSRLAPAVESSPIETPIVRPELQLTAMNGEDELKQLILDRVANSPVNSTRREADVT